MHVINQRSCGSIIIERIEIVWAGMGNYENDINTEHPHR